MIYTYIAKETWTGKEFQQDFIMMSSNWKYIDQRSKSTHFPIAFNQFFFEKILSGKLRLSLFAKLNHCNSIRIRRKPQKNKRLLWMHSHSLPIYRCDIYMYIYIYVYLSASVLGRCQRPNYSSHRGQLIDSIMTISHREWHSKRHILKHPSYHISYI